jgi:hypothetical protein
MTEPSKMYIFCQSTVSIAFFNWSNQIIETLETSGAEWDIFTYCTQIKICFNF